MLPLLALLTVLTRPPEQTPRACTWDEMSWTLFGRRTGGCEYHGALGVRVVSDSQVFVATECDDGRRHGLCMLNVITNADAVIPNWNCLGDDPRSRRRVLRRPPAVGVPIDCVRPVGRRSGRDISRGLSDRDQAYPVWFRSEHHARRFRRSETQHGVPARHGSVPLLRVPASALLPALNRGSTSADPMAGALRASLSRRRRLDLHDREISRKEGRRVCPSLCRAFRPLIRWTASPGRHRCQPTRFFFSRRYRG